MVAADRGELERAILARVRYVTPSAAGGGDADYEAGLGSAVTAAVGFSLESVERGRVAERVPITGCPKKAAKHGKKK